MAPSQHSIQFISSVPSEHSKRPLHKNSDYKFWEFLLNFLVDKIWEFQKQKTFYSLAYFYTYLGKCIEASLHLFKSPHHIKIKSKNFPFFFMKLLVACQIFPILITYVGYSNIFRKWAKSMHYIEEGNANVHK